MIAKHDCYFRSGLDFRALADSGETIRNPENEYGVAGTPRLRRAF